MNPLPNHGTKILGGVMAALSALLSDPSIFGAFGHYGIVAALALSGVLTFLRGFQNSSNASPPSVGSGSASSTAKMLFFAFVCSPLLALLCLSGCKTNPFATTSAQPYIQAAVLVAVSAAEQKGVPQLQINAIAHQALTADSGTSGTLAAISQLINTQLSKLNLNPGDMQAVQILEVALSAAIASKIADNASVANTQAAIADVLNYVIADTGG